MSKRIYIQNLPFSLEEELLAAAITDVLSAFGTVVSLTCLCEGTSMRPKNLWFAEMGSDSEAYLAIEQLDGIRVAGHKLKVAEAKPFLRRPKRRFTVDNQGLDTERRNLP